ncbi:BLOC-1-related complex subunit 5 [Patella vulgata]|uniref:BLOC-1-related complex subunit 5 n=1 Tax=Patella vulgata TaxID=6465 RepID=UPI00217F58AF|nr:BLOC-1-related complex subunit 5 [Patella vulgata]
MGSDQSTLPAGAPGSNLRSQRDEEIPYTQYSISKPIDGGSPRLSPRITNKNKTSPKLDREAGGTPKHDIVVVAEGTTSKSKDLEVDKLNSVPVFFPIMRGSLNIPVSSRDTDLLDKLDYKQLLLMSLRYQEHLKQLSEAVAFDQNALCIRIKEIDHTVNILLGNLNERQKKYTKYADQTKRINETLTALQKIQKTMDGIIPKMENLNKLLPPEEQLESFSMRPKSIGS